MKGAQNTRRGGNRSETGTFLYMLLGPIVWALHFTLIYGAHTLLCLGKPSTAPAAGIDSAALVIFAATFVALCMLAAAVAFPAETRRLFFAAGWPAEQRKFQHRTMILLASLSALGIVWAGASAAFVNACMQLR